MKRDASAAFATGVRRYFADFGHRTAREIAHQTWLLISVSRYVDPQLIVSELDVPNRDLRPFGNIRSSNGALGFDFAITRSEIDLRPWKARTPGWHTGAPTTCQTLERLREVSVLAEMKIAGSTSTTTAALEADLEKLRAAILFMDHHRLELLPACFLVVLDPQGRLDLQVRRAIDSVTPRWPKRFPFPTVLIGPGVPGPSGQDRTHLTASRRR